jgi:hypothetical protein
MVFQTARRLALPMGFAFCVAADASIVGGHAIGIEEAPWQLRLRTVYPDTLHSCGAVWGGRWALTAGHCVDSGLTAAGILRSCFKSRKGLFPLNSSEKSIEIYT